MSMPACVKCQKPLDGIYTSDVQGLKHPWCYEREHPFVPATSFRQVVNTSYDPVLARQLIGIYTPDNIAQLILEQYNVEAKAQWEDRCKEF